MSLFIKCAILSLKSLPESTRGAIPHPFTPNPSTTQTTSSRFCVVSSTYMTCDKTEQKPIGMC